MLYFWPGTAIPPETISTLVSFRLVIFCRGFRKGPVAVHVRWRGVKNCWVGKISSCTSLRCRKPPNFLLPPAEITILDGNSGTILFQDASRRNLNPTGWQRNSLSFQCWSGWLPRGMTWRRVLWLSTHIFRPASSYLGSCSPYWQRSRSHPLALFSPGNGRKIYVFIRPANSVIFWLQGRKEQYLYRWEFCVVFCFCLLFLSSGGFHSNSARGWLAHHNLRWTMFWGRVSWPDVGGARGSGWGLSLWLGWCRGGVRVRRCSDGWPALRSRAKWGKKYACELAEHDGFGGQVESAFFVSDEHPSAKVDMATTWLIPRRQNLEKGESAAGVWVGLFGGHDGCETFSGVDGEDEFLWGFEGDDIVGVQIVGLVALLLGWVLGVFGECEVGDVRFFVGWEEGWYFDGLAHYLNFLEW